MVLSVYQIDRLWFEEGAGQTFLSSLFSQNQQLYDISYYKYFTQPKRIITKTLDNRFSVSYTDISESSIHNIFNTVIAEMLQTGQYDDEYVIDYNFLLEKPVIIYEYAFMMNSVIFSEVYSSRSNLLSRVEKFDCIYMIAEEDGINVFFANSESSLMYKYILSNNISLAERVKEEIKFFENEADFYYASSKLLNLDIDKSLFFPMWESEEHVFYNPIKVMTSYYKYGDLTKTNLFRNIRYFFDNPEAVWDSTDISDRFTFSDNYTVVRYLENDVLDYSNYRINQINRGSSFLDDFAQAISFIKSDPMMTNQLYLSDYEEMGTIRTFYFNYVHNNAPVILTDTFDDKVLPIPYHIEITIIDGTLTKYRKFAYTFETAKESFREANADILYLLDSVEVSDINFGYRLLILDKNEYGKEIGLTVGIIDNDGRESYIHSATISREPSF